MIIIQQNHKGTCGGHFAKDNATCKILMACYFWPILFHDCSQFCRTCKICQTYGKRNLPHIQLHPIIPIRAFKKWEVDFADSLPKIAKGNRCLIVTTHYLTKWIQASAMKRCTKKVATKFIFSQVICLCGCPLEIVTDRRSHFVNDLIVTLLEQNVGQTLSYHYLLDPKVNGLVEKANGVIFDIIAKIVCDKHQEWDLHVGEAL
jgi:hypothetical protein